MLKPLFLKLQLTNELHNEKNLQWAPTHLSFYSKCAGDILIDVDTTQRHMASLCKNAILGVA